MVGEILFGSIAWIIGITVLVIIINAVWVCDTLNFLQPHIIYHNTKLNYFGVGFVFLIFNVVCAPVAIWFWFYKLCTVGRR